MESQPNPCPHNFEGLIRLLATYQKLLTVLSGTQCSHFLEVRAIRCTLVCNMPQFAELLAESIAQLLWSIHLDARRFFSAPLSQDSTLLKSQFKYTSSGWLDTGSVKTIVGCPIDRLLGLPSAPATALPGPPAGAMADWMTAAPPEHHNNTVHPFLAAAVLPACNKKASIKMTDLINATNPPVPYNDIRLGAAGSCLDLIILGKCVNLQCTFSQAACGTISDVRAREVVRHLQPGINAFVTS